MDGLDYRTYPVLCVDDEESNLVVMRYALEDHFAVESTSSPVQAAELLATKKYALLLSDQRMPGMSGVDLCAHARVVSPDTVRIILTGYADLHATIDAVNRGAVMRYLEKPVRDTHLQEVVRSAIDVVHAKKAMRVLENQMLRGGSDEAFRAVGARLGKDLQRPTRQLADALEHLRDLTTALHQIQGGNRPKETPDTPEDVSSIPILEDMTHAHDSVEVTLQMFRTLANRLQHHRSGYSTHADVRRIVRSIEAMAGRSGKQSLPPLEVIFEPSALAEALGTFFRRAMSVSSNPLEARIGIEVGDPVIVCITDTGPRLNNKDFDALFDARSDPLPGDDGRAMAMAREIIRSANAGLDATQAASGCVIRVALDRQP